MAMTIIVNPFAINSDRSGHDGPKPKLMKDEVEFISRIKGFFKYQIV